MASYYVNRRQQANGDHEVHDKASCPPQYFPQGDNAEYLGEFASCSQAVTAARTRYRQVNGCYWCARACHTQ
jgi:hypothetical protein